MRLIIKKCVQGRIKGKEVVEGVEAVCEGNYARGSMNVNWVYEIFKERDF